MKKQTKNNIKKAVILARVSTREQEETGLSIPAQLERLYDYANRKEIKIDKEFAFSESAGPKIRKKFEEVIAYIKKNKDVNVLLCQNVDRATRNFKDAVEIDEMRMKRNLEIHFVQDNLIINAQSQSTEMFQWETKVLFGKQCLNRISDDVKRSQFYKISTGEWIGKAPLGYLNFTDPETGRPTIRLDEERAFLVKRLFEEYATGEYSLSQLVKKVRQWGLTSKGRRKCFIGKSQLDQILKNPFYYGFMRFKERLHPHNHPKLIDERTFLKCEAVRNGYHKQPFKYDSLDFVFKGLIKCARCGCAYSSYEKKGHVYLRPTKSKGVTVSPSKKSNS